MGNAMARVTGSGQQKRKRSQMEDSHSPSSDGVTQENTVKISIQDRRRGVLGKPRGLRINTALTHGDGLSSEKATPAQLNTEPITPGRSPSQPSSHPHFSFKQRLDMARAKSEAEIWVAQFSSDIPLKSDSPTPEGPPRKRMKPRFQANHCSTTKQCQLSASDLDDWFWSREENRVLLASKAGNHLRYQEQQISSNSDDKYLDSDRDISDIEQHSPKSFSDRSSSGSNCATYNSSHDGLQDSSPVTSLATSSPALMYSPGRSGDMADREVIDLTQSDGAEDIQSAKEETNMTKVFIAGNDRYARWREVQLGAREAQICLF